MINLFDRFIDEPFLRAAKWIVKRFNWATGKDEICLARFVVRAGLIIFIPMFNLITWQSISYGIGISVCALCFLGSCFFCWKAIGPFLAYIEESKTTDQLRGVQLWETTHDLKSARVAFWVMLVTFLTIALLNKPSVALQALTFIPSSSAIILCAFYIASVDRPPFSRSQLPDWLRKFVPVPERKLVPAPIPR